MSKQLDLSKRLQAVANLVSPKRRVADIGCDHGYVSIYLADVRKCPKVIAMDVRKGPLSQAQNNIHRFGMDDRIETRLSDGTALLKPDEVDTLLISGMGGRLIMRIVSEGLDRLGTFKELVLQPQSEAELVRKFLREHDYIIVDEDFVIEDGKNYPMMKAIYASYLDEWDKESGQQHDAFTLSGYSIKQQDLFGPVLLKKRPADFCTFLYLKKKKTEEILQQITQPEKRKEMQDYLQQLIDVSKGM